MRTGIEIEFLRESNNIEGIFDDLSLQQAIFAWEYLLEKPDLSRAIILQTHAILMKYQDLKAEHKGALRTVEVTIGGRLGMPWKYIPMEMQQWCEEANSVTTGIGIKTSHIAYEKIHPFVDGNGRTGRIFMNWQRLRSGLPILVIKDAEKQAYYKWFK